MCLEILIVNLHPQEETTGNIGAPSISRSHSAEFETEGTHYSLLIAGGWNLTFHITLINTHITVTIGIDLSDAEMESKQPSALLAKTQAENRSLKQRISELANRELEISAEQNKV